MHGAEWRVQVRSTSRLFAPCPASNAGLGVFSIPPLNNAPMSLLSPPPSLPATHQYFLGSNGSSLSTERSHRHETAVVTVSVKFRRRQPAKPAWLLPPSLPRMLAVVRTAKPSLHKTCLARRNDSDPPYGHLSGKCLSPRIHPLAKPPAMHPATHAHTEPTTRTGRTAALLAAKRNALVLTAVLRLSSPVNAEAGYPQAQRARFSSFERTFEVQEYK